MAPSEVTELKTSWVNKGYNNFQFIKMDRQFFDYQESGYGLERSSVGLDFKGSTI